LWEKKESVYREGSGSASELPEPCLFGIARALLVEPDILIFDEATSNLDSESERSIQLAMRSLAGTRTVIIIAHRLSTVREADKIIVLDQGQIAEVGTHEALLHQQGIYHRLHVLQTAH
jgi:ATP-binding cassette subfamily B protein